jgi:putative transposase
VVKPVRKKAIVRYLMNRYQIDIRRACRSVRLPRSCYYYSSVKDPLLALRQRLRELAQVRVRFGMPQLWWLMKRQGRQVGRCRFERVYLEEGVALRRKRPWRHVTAVHREVRKPARQRNEIWSMDFVMDEIASGHKFRALTIVDLFTRECVEIEVRPRLKAEHVVQALERLKYERGCLPQRLYCDNGSEFASLQMDRWATTACRSTSRDPENPLTNAFIESFNGRFRGECLNTHWFETLEDAKEKINRWKWDYNENRPHRALKGLSPGEFVRTLNKSAADSHS